MYSSIISKMLPKPSCCRFISTISPGENVTTPQYPEILDMSKEAVKKRERLAKHKKIDELKTVEEKLFALNMDKYYGWNSFIFSEGSYPYNFLPFVKHITRTYLKEADKNTFHKAQGLNLEESQELISRIRPYLQEVLLYELSRKPTVSSDTDTLSQFIVHKISDVLHTYFSNHYPHLQECMTDHDCRVEAFWSVGGFHPSPEVYEERDEDEKLSKEEKEERVEHWIQYLGRPCVQVRSSLPLDIHESTVFDNVVIPEPVPHDPTLAFGCERKRRFGTNLPGFWPGDKNEFGLMSYHLTNHLDNRPPHFGESDRLNTTHSQAILASFGWLHAQASFQGFSTFSDLTYPLVTQTILTDGRVFSFYLYQLNTTLFYADHIETNPRINSCLALQPTPLYQEIKGNEFIGWNDEVLSSLLSCYLNRPKQREGIDLKPHIDKDEKFVANISDPERREWLHSQFRHMYSNRPRHKLPYEIYDWERIYKIKFKTRPMEARSRPFERDTDPLEERKYYEHMHRYIPRAERTRKKHWTGWRAKFAKTYYPEI